MTALVAQVADQEAEQVAGRPIGPVEVLDDEQQRARARRSGSRTPSRSSNRRPCADPTLNAESAPSGAAPRSGISRASSSRPWPTTASSSSGSRAGRSRGMPRRPGRRQRAFTEVDAPARPGPGQPRGQARSAKMSQPRLADAGLAGNEEGAALTLPRTVEPGASLSSSRDDRSGQGWRRGRPCPRLSAALDSHHRRTSLVRRLRRCVPVGASARAPASLATIGAAPWWASPGVWPPALPRAGAISAQPPPSVPDFARWRRLPSRSCPSF